jgi:hypothetical protein
MDLSSFVPTRRDAFGLRLYKRDRTVIARMMHRNDLTARDLLDEFRRPFHFDGDRRTRSVEDL